MTIRRINMSGKLNQMYIKVTGKNEKEFNEAFGDYDQMVVQSVIEHIEGNLIIQEVVEKHKGWTFKAEREYAIFSRDGSLGKDTGFIIESLGHLIKIMEYRFNELKKANMEFAYGEDYETEFRAIYEDLKLAHADWIKKRGKDTVL